MSNGRKTANATASGECFCNTVTGSIAVENPKVVSVEWVDERGDKATTVKYGVPVSLRVTTEDGPRCSIILYVQCDGWRQEYVSITRVAARDVPYATEETTITFTPDAGWLNPSGSASRDITATVFLVWNKDQLGQGDEAMLRGFVQGFKDGSIGLREFWRFRAPVFFDFKEAETLPVSQIVIVIDPGHGFRRKGVSVVDPGATNGVDYEKDHVLTIANKLNAILTSANPSMKVCTTRTGDVDNTSWTPLQWRLDKATGANMFVSLHLNSSDSKLAEGYEVLFKAGCAESQRLAEDIVKENTLFKKRGTGCVSSSAYVLANFNSGPAVLVESGFISNEADLFEIKNSSSQIAEEIAKGILKNLNL